MKRTLRLCEVDYVPALRCAWFGRLPHPLPRGYSDGIIRTKARVTPAVALHLGQGLMKRGFEVQAHAHGAHYRRNPSKK